MPAAKKPTAKSIWTTLSQVNVNEHVESKNGLTYLSWAWAWTIMMSHFPEFHIEWATHTDKDGVTTDVCYYRGGTASVTCTVTIGDISREMWLPILNYRNAPIESPNAFEINTAKMRCMTKAFAAFGLGAYIYAGEDLPQNGKDSRDESYQKAKEELQAVVKAAEKHGAVDVDALAAARSLLGDSQKPTGRIQKATTYLKTQLD